jgi:hypothetical protein
MNRLGLGPGLDPQQHLSLHDEMAAGGDEGGTQEKDRSHRLIHTPTVPFARTLRQRWLLAWIGGAAIGVPNGVSREATYGRRLEDETSNRVSVPTAIAAFAAYFRHLQRRWPLGGRSEALRIGGAWLALTVAFEFTFGRLVAKKPWRELAAEW